MIVRILLINLEYLDIWIRIRKYKLYWVAGVFFRGATAFRIPDSIGSSPVFTYFPFHASLQIWIADRFRGRLKWQQTIFCIPLYILLLLLLLAVGTWKGIDLPGFNQGYNKMVKHDNDYAGRIPISALKVERVTFCAWGGSSNEAIWMTRVGSSVCQEHSSRERWV